MKMKIGLFLVILLLAICLTPVAMAEQATATESVDANNDFLTVYLPIIVLAAIVLAIVLLSNYLRNTIKRQKAVENAINTDEVTGNIR